jgi:uncharacterized protein (DUF983 family)
MDTYAPPVPALKAGLTARCPRCGEGALFSGALALRERCGKCDLDYKFIDTGDGPAVFGIMILGFLILGGALILEFKIGPPLWVHLALWGIGTPLLALGLLRFLKALLIALQFKHKAGQGQLEEPNWKNHDT